MKVYIQSKSGNYNTVTEWPDGMFIDNIFKELRAYGYYRVVTQLREAVGQELLVPFEEIEFIREATDDDY
jgi:hypothetical protein